MTATRRSCPSCATFVCWALLLPAAPATGQEPPPDSPATSPPQPPPGIDYDSEPPYTFYERQWNRRFAAPYRRPFRSAYYPYGRPYYPRRYNYATPYDYGYHDPYSYGDADTFVFDGGYETGFHDGRRFQEWQTRAELGLSGYLKAMQAGSSYFRNGAYGAATRQFILAAKLNQGDAASRLRAVHGMTALGRYSGAVPTLRRALQLQPKLIYLPLDVRSDYGPGNDFEVHRSKLAEAARQVGDDAGLWLLLGYYQLFSDGQADAGTSLERATQLDPHDSAAARLLEAARLTTPAERPAENKTPAPETGDSV